MKRLNVIGLLLGLSLCAMAGAATPMPEPGIRPAGLLLAEAGQGPATQAKRVPAKKAPTQPPAGKQPKKAANKTPARKQADAIANELPKPKLDLTLPKGMVQKLEPQAKIDAEEVPKPVLPKLFEQKPPDGFELNGRLLSNEMDLNLRTEARKDVDGAALDFKFPQ
ncbi:translation initiation factor 2 [Pseudomonas typographi]|uniref:translation initiation factor 2 n=1 Tax=Pseudomonas typographi TaxID=2715964 RepID=UPI001EED6CFE|nr:translation initiation factor 2 [Pseudomonas typographi]